MSYVGKVNYDGNSHLVASTLYGTCTTEASTVAKVATCANFDKLITGVTIHIKFTYANTASNITLNVNSTGAKNIFHNGTQITTGYTKGYLSGVVEFVYDGTQWNLIGNQGGNILVGQLNG